MSGIVVAFVRAKYGHLQIFERRSINWEIIYNSGCWNLSRAPTQDDFTADCHGGVTFVELVVDIISTVDSKHRNSTLVAFPQSTNHN